MLTPSLVEFGQLERRCNKVVKSNDKNHGMTDSHGAMKVTVQYMLQFTHSVQVGILIVFWIDYI